MRVRLRLSVGILTFCFVLCAMACKPMVDAKIASFEPIKKVFNCDANRAYYAIRWALAVEGYPVASEDFMEGIIKTGWVATTSDSHYIDPFGHRDYNVGNSYHRIILKVSPVAGGTEVEISSNVKTVLAMVKTSYIQERKILARIASYLRSPEVGLTNLGLEE